MRALRLVGATALIWGVLAGPVPSAQAAGFAQDDHEHIESIVVTATPGEHNPDELAVPVTVLTREDLLEASGFTLGETLQRQPGITTSGFAPGASRPIIRGQDLSRVRTLENGIGTGDVSTLSQDHGLPVNPLAQRRIEVVRGPATLRYGGGAIAGVVNAINDRVPRQRLDRLIQGEVFGVYGTNGNQRDAGFLIDGGRGPLSWHFDGVSRDSDDYELPDTSRDEPFTETDGYGLSGGLAWIGDRGRIGLSISRFANEYGIPAPEDPGVPISIDLDSDRYSLEADWLNPVSFLDWLQLRGAYIDYEHKEIAGGVEVGSTFDNQEWEARLEALHVPLVGWTGALGLQLQDRELDASGEGGELLAPSDLSSWSVYLFEERPLGQRWTLQLGGRVERTELEGTPIDEIERDEDFTPLSGSLGLVYEAAPGISIGLSLSATQRAPDTLELFARGPHEATETFEIGDPDLDEETSYNADLRFHAHRESWETELSLFYTEYDDFIFGQLTGVIRDDLEELVYLHDDATFYGFEARGHYDLADLGGGTLGLEGQFDFVRGRLDAGNVPRIPPIRWGGALFFKHPRASARVGFFRNEEQDRLGQGETDTSAYSYLNASLTFSLTDPSSPSGLQLSVAGTNLLDEKGRNHVSLKKEDVVLPGRNVRVGLRGRF